MTAETKSEPEQAAPDAGAKTILTSLTLKGALAMGLAFVAGRLGLAMPDAELAQIADAIVQIVFYAGLLAVGIGRSRAKGPLS
ncbi:MAG: hypothetical protein AB7M12_14445 [Hyphomonadaceae bacterium]